jgi:hypothetical protein
VLLPLRSSFCTYPRSLPVHCRLREQPRQPSAALEHVCGLGKCMPVSSLSFSRPMGN